MSHDIQFYIKEYYMCSEKATMLLTYLHNNRRLTKSIVQNVLSTSDKTFDAILDKNLILNSKILNKHGLGGQNINTRALFNQNDARKSYLESILKCARFPIV